VLDPGHNGNNARYLAESVAMSVMAVQTISPKTRLPVVTRKRRSTGCRELLTAAYGRRRHSHPDPSVEHRVRPCIDSAAIAHRTHADLPLVIRRLIETYRRFVMSRRATRLHRTHRTAVGAVAAGQDKTGFRRRTTSC
jgi:hypothetical protein